MEAGGCWQLPAIHSFQITYKHKDFSFCGTPDLVHALLHKHVTQEPLHECSHIHSKLRGTGTDRPKVTQQESKGHLGLSGSIHGSPQCSKPISMEQGRRAQSGLRTSPSSAGSGTEGGGRGGQSFLLCPFPFFPLPAHPPTTASQALCSKESVCFLAELTDGQASVLRPVT